MALRGCGGVPVHQLHVKWCPFILDSAACHVRTQDALCVPADLGLGAPHEGPEVLVLALQLQDLAR